MALLDQQYNKYRLVESQLLRSSDSMRTKVPEIEKTIQMITALKKNPCTFSFILETHVDFMLSDGIYAKAKPKKNLSKISLWLGASTVVELTFEEALTMLALNLSNARNSLKQINEELEYIKDQKTTTEVNVARVYNHSILENREAQLKKDNTEE